MVLGYKSGLKSVEERLEFFKTNESIYSEDIKKLKFEIHCNEITIRELRKNLETVQREKDGIQLTVEKLKNASKTLNKLIDTQIVENCKKGLGYNAVPPPHTDLFMPPKPYLSYIGLEEFTSEPAVKTLNTSEEVPKVVKKDNGAPIIEDWKSDDKDESVPQPKIEKKTVKPSVSKIKANTVVNTPRPKAVLNAIKGNKDKQRKVLSLVMEMLLEKELELMSDKQRKVLSLVMEMLLEKELELMSVISSSDDEALDKEDTSKHGGIDEIYADEDTTLVSTHDDVSTQDNTVQDEGIDDVGKEEVVEVVTTAKIIIDAVVDTAQVTTAIVDIPVSAAETIVTTAPTITVESTKTNVKVQDKGKRKEKLIKEPEMPKKRKHQIRANKELVKKLQAKMQTKIDEKDRLAREKAQKEQESNDALINTWDDIQAKIDADAQLVQRLHEEEQLQLTDAEKAKLFMEFIEKRRKLFVAKRAEEKRNKPHTKAQQRNIMCNYLKNIEGWKLKSLKNKSFAEIQTLFEKSIKRVNNFVDYRTELVVEDEGIEDVDEEVVKVVTTAKMIIDAVVYATQVTTAIADISVSAAAAGTIVTTTPTITVESTKTNVEVTQAPKRKGVTLWCSVSH
nr:hypothetical protein [Tanacetum cinerariifolium]